MSGWWQPASWRNGLTWSATLDRVEQIAIEQGTKHFVLRPGAGLCRQGVSGRRCRPATSAAPTAECYPAHHDATAPPRHRADHGVVSDTFHTLGFCCGFVPGGVEAGIGGDQALHASQLRLMHIAMIWFSASCSFTSLPNSVGLLALPLRITSAEGSNKLTILPSLWLSP
jgi:hypothetical protein